MALPTLNHADVCAGTGGLGLALKIAVGEHLRTVVYIEREAYAAAALVARMADKALDTAPVWDRLESFDARRFNIPVDILSAGFPCQPFSLAGKRKGTKDERWLWNDIVDIIRALGCPLVWLENVPGLTLTDTDGKGWALPAGLWHVLGDLAAMGYDAQWGCIRASDVGAPHERARLFILGYAASLDQSGHCLSSLNRTWESRGRSGGPMVDASSISSGPRSGEIEALCGEENRGSDQLESALGDSENTDWRGQLKEGASKRGRTGSTGTIGRVVNAADSRRTRKRSGSTPEERREDSSERIEGSLDSRELPSRLERSSNSLADSRRLAEQGHDAPVLRERQTDGATPKRRKRKVDDSAAARTGSVPERPWREGPGTPNTERPIGELANSDLRGQPECREPIQVREKRSNLGQSVLPVFPPGPGLGGYGVLDNIRELFRTDPDGAWRRYQAELHNTREWSRILEVDPTLEPAFHGVLNGTANRVDRLRLAGGGVCVLAAATAFHILATRLGLIRKVTV